jgi:hypothetical protein
VEYNQRFYENLRNAGLTVIPPLVVSALVVDMAHNNLNTLVGAFSLAFTLGYVLTFGAQILAATCIRLAVFGWWERDVFSLAPEVPLPMIPWVLGDKKYRVKPITLITQDLVTSAVVCPLIEEFVKLILLQWSVPLSKYVHVVYDS